MNCIINRTAVSGIPLKKTAFYIYPSVVRTCDFTYI